MIDVDGVGGLQLITRGVEFKREMETAKGVGNGLRF